MALPAIAAAAGALALRELAKEGGGAAGRGLVGAAGRGFCNVHANNPNIVGRLGPIASDFADGACKPYFDENGITPPSPSQNPFSGGQCEGIQYLVEVAWEKTGYGTVTTNTYTYGPVRGAVTEPAPNGNRRLYVSGHDTQGEPFLYSVGIATSQDASTFRITSVDRADGDPDDCGDAPNQYNPSPNAPPGRYGDPFDGEDSSDREFPITIFPPSINPDGTVSIPIDIDGTPGDLGAEPPPPSGKPEDRKPVEPGDAKEPKPEDGGKVCFNAINGKELVGVTWNLVIPDGFGEIPQALIPIFPRVVGNIRLLLGACDVGTGLVEDQIQIRTAKGSIFRSIGGMPVAGAVINVLPNVGVSLTPLYVEVDEEND